MRKGNNLAEREREREREREKQYLFCADVNVLAAAGSHTDSIDQVLLPQKEKKGKKRLLSLSFSR